MAHVIRQPCDEGVIRSTEAQSVCTLDAAPWVLAATILGSSMAFIDLIEGKKPGRSAEQPFVEEEIASDPLES
jgi:hypothetical protein